MKRPVCLCNNVCCHLCLLTASSAVLLVPFLPLPFALLGVMGYGTLENYVGSLHAGTSVVTTHWLHPQLTALRKQQTRLRG
jgi:hypothetical protein